MHAYIFLEPMLTSKRVDCFFVGRFGIQIDGSNDLIDSFFNQMSLYRQLIYPCEELVLLHLVLGLEKSKADLSQDWCYQEVGNGKHRAIYCGENNPLFALQYMKPKLEIVVKVGQVDARNISLGIQYGMMLALYQKCIGLHGVTILCGNEIVILSAPSGTGKTTLAQLLETYDDAIIINGDFALLSLSDEGVFFEPTPFCGSSGRCINHRLRVNRVVFLEQSKSNRWQEQTTRESLVYFMNNVFVPTWDRELQQIVQENIMRCISFLKVNTFSFAPTRDAAEMFSNHLNHDEGKSS